MRKRTSYSADFKREALDLAARADVGPRRAAQDLGINPSVLYRWQRQEREKGAQAFPGHGRQYLTPEQLSHSNASERRMKSCDRSAKS